MLVTGVSVARHMRTWSFYYFELPFGRLQSSFEMGDCTARRANRVGRVNYATKAIHIASIRTLSCAPCFQRTVGLGTFVAETEMYQRACEVDHVQFSCQWCKL
jgi:hypothetical protein